MDTLRFSTVLHAWHSLQALRLLHSNTPLGRETPLILDRISALEACLREEPTDGRMMSLAFLVRDSARIVRFRLDLSGLRRDIQLLNKSQGNRGGQSSLGESLASKIRDSLNEIERTIVDDICMCMVATLPVQTRFEPLTLDALFGSGSVPATSCVPRVALRAMSDAIDCLNLGSSRAAATLAIGAVESTLRFAHVRWLGAETIMPRKKSLWVPGWRFFEDNLSTAGLITRDEQRELSDLRTTYRDQLMHARPFENDHEATAKIVKKALAAIRRTLMGESSTIRPGLTPGLRIPEQPSLESLFVTHLYQTTVDFPEFGTDKLEVGTLPTAHIAQDIDLQGFCTTGTGPKAIHSVAEAISLIAFSPDAQAKMTALWKKCRESSALRGRAQDISLTGFSNLESASCSSDLSTFEDGVDGLEDPHLTIQRVWNEMATLAQHPAAHG